MSRSALAGLSPEHSANRGDRPFLTARWSNLILITYAVPPALLEPRLPPGLRLDSRDGEVFVSLVAFDFLETRVLGVPWPGYRNFPEINLRFYVRAGDERGVVFVREFVPRCLIAWAARWIYNEPYRTASMTSRVEEGTDHMDVEHRWRWRGRDHLLAVRGLKPAYRPDETSVEHFFKEHQWGYGVGRSGKTLRYEVQHPAWDVYRVESVRMEVDWEQLYGPEWRFLATAKPYSTVLAAGSPVAVYPHGALGQS